MAGVAITRTDMSAADLRAAAKRSANAKQGSRILAIAMVLDGFSREEAARLCGMDRQTLRDWVHRYNKEGLEGLADRARSGRPASLSWVEQGKLASWVEQGADLARDGVVRFRRADLRDRIAAEFGVTLHERSVGKLLRRLNFRRLSVRPQHPQSDPVAQETFKKTSQPSPRKRLASALLASRSRSGSRTKQELASKAR
jgi:transposase